MLDDETSGEMEPREEEPGSGGEKRQKNKTRKSERGREGRGIH